MGAPQGRFWRRCLSGTRSQAHTRVAAWGPGSRSCSEGGDGKGSVVLSGGAALPWDRVLRTVTSCYLGICKKGFVGLNSVLTGFWGRLLVTYQREV